MKNATPHPRSPGWLPTLLSMLVTAWIPLPSAAEPAFEGRWEGRVAIPGAPMALIVDLAADKGGLRAWITLPGRGTHGQALAAPQLQGSTLRLDASAAFAQMGPPRPPPTLVLQADAGRLRGQWQQAGHEAPVTLKRTGAAQPQVAPRNTSLSGELHGTWRGSYEIGGVPRQVTLTLTRDAAVMVIVGRRTVTVPFDAITQGDQFLTLAAGEMGITLEGRWRTASGAYEATFVQGPFELPLTLRKETRP